MKKKVTWLIPIQNGMPYLQEMLASIESQTYKNWQVLAYNDGSTDGTLEELRKWIPSRLPGQIFSSKSIGVGRALAQMVDHCETEFCARIDADDINRPDRLEKQMSFFDRNPDISVLGSQMYCIDRKGTKLKYLYSVPTSHSDILHLLLFKNSMAHPSVVFRRSAVLSVGNYAHFSNVEDYDLWLRLSLYYKFANISEPLVYYRVHDKSVSQIAHAQNMISDRLNERFYEHAPLLFGCSRNEAVQLREHHHPLSIKVLLKIASHLQDSQVKGENLQSGGFRKRLRSASFVEAGRQLTSPTDIVSHLYLAALDPHKWEIPMKCIKPTIHNLRKRLVASAFTAIT